MGAQRAATTPRPQEVHGRHPPVKSGGSWWPGRSHGVGSVTWLSLKYEPGGRRLISCRLLRLQTSDFRLETSDESSVDLYREIPECRLSDAVGDLDREVVEPRDRWRSSNRAVGGVDDKRGRS